MKTFLGILSPGDAEPWVVDPDVAIEARVMRKTLAAQTSNAKGTLHSTRFLSMGGMIAPLVKL
jgi:hypothetical protein